MNPSIVDELIGILDRVRTPESRFLVAISGPPGAGKSTLAGLLHQKMAEQRGEGSCSILPMDGFHLDNDILDQRGLRQIKGAPETFDVAGFISTLTRVRKADTDVFVPVFDRSMDLTRAGARLILAEQRLILVEGNYLLLEQAGWQSLYSLFDYRIGLEVDQEVLTTRLEKRWLDHDHTLAEAKKRAASNDLPNAQVVAEHSRTPDCVIKTDRRQQTTLEVINPG